MQNTFDVTVCSDSIQQRADEGRRRVEGERNHKPTVMELFIEA